MKIELTIKASYLPDWKTQHGVREIIQNAKDAETEFDAPMSVWHSGKTLFIQNDGCSLTHEALLFGHTTKLDRQSEMRGKFGEGLKLGMLALVRDGKKVRIRTGGEVWVPSIERSDKFNANVLVCTITPNKKTDDIVKIEIDGISPEEWLSFSKNFRFLDIDKKEENKDFIHTRYGDLLLGKLDVGRIYVKGIFVCNDPKLTYGYDFSTAEIDRDRRIMSSWDLEYNIRKMWSTAIAERPDMIDPWYKMLSNNSRENTAFETTWALAEIPEQAKEHVKKKFVETHGDEAFPVTNIAQSAEIGHYGKRGIVVSGGIGTILNGSFGDVDTQLEKLKTETKKLYSWHELTTVQQMNIEWCINTLVGAGIDVKLDTVLIVDFNSETLHGLFENGKISIAIKETNDKFELMSVIIHEYAHNEGGDGTKGHVAEIERINKAVMIYLCRGNKDAS